MRDGTGIVTTGMNDFSRGLDEYLFNADAEKVIQNKIGDPTATVPGLSYLK